MRNKQEDGATCNILLVSYKIRDILTVINRAIIESDNETQLADRIVESSHDISELIKEFDCADALLKELDK